MLQNIKFWIAIIIIAIIFFLGICLFLQNKKIKTLETDLSTAVINLKAYEAENDSLINKNIEYNYTIDQLNYSQDSLVNILNNARKSLKIKDKQLQELQYLASLNRKIDTIRFTDTIFKAPSFEMDTLVGDEWAKLNIHLKYPNIIDADYSFKNETLVISSSRKETVDPPKKCWLLRLFQKKHTIVDVEVIQNNPYCENEKHKHIKIVD